MIDLNHYRIAPLILVVLGLSAGLGKLSEFLHTNIWEHHGWVGGVSVVSVIGGFLKVYDQWLWKFPVFRWLVHVPCIAGKYSGRIDYEFEDVQSTKRIKAVVTQTASRVSVYCRFFSTDPATAQVTKSRSIHAELVERDDHWQLCMLYLNEGERAKGSTSPHDGFAALDLFNGGLELSGHYFTGRKTRGEMVLKREAN